MLTKADAEKYESELGVECSLVSSARTNAAGEPVWQLVIRAPTRADYKLYRAQIHNPAQVANAQEILLIKSCVYPPRDALDALLNKYPAIPEACSKALLALLGAEGDELGKGLGRSAMSSGNIQGSSRTDSRTGYAATTRSTRRPPRTTSRRFCCYIDRA